MALAQPNIVALPRKLLLQLIDAPAHLNSSSSQNVQGFYLFPSDRANTHVDVATAITFTALLLVFSLMAFFSVYLRRCYMLRHINNQSPPTLPPSPLLLPLPPQGLHPLILQTLPRFTFSSFPHSPSPSPSSSLLPSSAPAALPMNSMKKKKKMKNECVICLEEFGDEEILLLLPLCGHVFHCQCIHMWLFSHTTCPLCRHSLLTSPHTSPTGELDAICSQNPSAYDSSVDVEVPLQPTAVSLQMDAICIECKERESSRLNTALKPKKLRNGELRRSYSMGGCLVMKEEGEGSHSSSFKATNMNMDMNGELRRSSPLVLSDESLLLHHHHPLNSEHSKGKDAKIGRSRSFCLKFMKRSSSDKLMKRRFDDGECSPSSSLSSSSPKLATSSSVKKRALTRFLSAKEPFYCQPKQEPLP